MLSKATREQFEEVMNQKPEVRVVDDYDEIYLMNNHYMPMLWDGIGNIDAPEYIGDRFVELNIKMYQNRSRRGPN
jgi:hypothetical protein